MAYMHVLDKQTGAVRRLEVRGAKILIALGKAEPLPLVEDGAPAYQTRAMTAAPVMTRVQRSRDETGEQFAERAEQELQGGTPKRGPGRPRKAP